MQRYGANEYRYARPIAEAPEEDSSFRVWFLSQTRFASHAATAKLLSEEQKATRSPNAENWWRSYFAGSSYPFKSECGERETDLLAVFEATTGLRFALHIEVKSPGDKFGVQQARDYGRRAKCWSGTGRAPGTVLSHEEASTVLCSERGFAEKRRPEAELFDAFVSFEDIAARLRSFPDAL